jgi:hypothetical protein
MAPPAALFNRPLHIGRSHGLRHRENLEGVHDIDQVGVVQALKSLGKFSVGRDRQQGETFGVGFEKNVCVPLSLSAFALKIDQESSVKNQRFHLASGG